MSLKDKYIGEKCFVFGNGPSLNASILKMIKDNCDIFCFATNGFALIFDQIRFFPDAVCMSNYEAIEKYAHLYPDNTVKFLKEGWSDRTKLSNVYELPFACSHELGVHKGAFIKDGNFAENPFEQNFCGDSVVLDFCIPLAYFMGFKYIYLIGVDCDYSKGYFTGKYEKSFREGFKGMINNDFSISIASFKYTYDFLKEKGRQLYKITESKKFDFIPDITLKEIVTSE